MAVKWITLILATIASLNYILFENNPGTQTAVVDQVTPSSPAAVAAVIDTIYLTQERRLASSKLEASSSSSLSSPNRTKICSNFFHTLQAAS